MRASVSFAVVTLGLSLLASPETGRTQADRDFVFADEDGHLLVRFVGTGATGLNSAQAYEISNAEFSSMVHDRLHADLRFEDEPRDPGWAAMMEPEIEAFVRHAGPELIELYIECRAESCRVVIEQPGEWDVPEHHVVLETVQASFQDFIAGHRHQFEPVFMITAYDQAEQVPHIKAFLRRVVPTAAEQADGG